MVARLNAVSIRQEEVRFLRVSPTYKHKTRERRHHPYRIVYARSPRLGGSNRLPLLHALTPKHMAKDKPLFRVTGVAPGRSGWAGRTVELGLCYTKQEANRCIAFWSLHYDDIQIHALFTQDNSDE